MTGLLPAGCSTLTPSSIDQGNRLWKLRLEWHWSSWWETEIPIPVLSLTLTQSRLPLPRSGTENGNRCVAPESPLTRSPCLALRVQEEPMSGVASTPSSHSAKRALGSCLEGSQWVRGHGGVKMGTLTLGRPSSWGNSEKKLGSPSGLGYLHTLDPWARSWSRKLGHLCPSTQLVGP